MPRPQILSLAERLDAHPDFQGRGVTLAFIDAAFFAHPDVMRPERRVRAFIDVAREKPEPSDFFAAHPRAWHGTMTACAAAGNGYASGGRFRGLAAESHVVLIKATDETGEILGKNIAAALRIPLRHKELEIRIVSISLGVEDDDPHKADVEAAVNELAAAGILVVAAAGNAPGELPEVPGASAAALTVGGGNDGNTADKADDTAWPSSYGTVRPGVDKPDMLAPACWLPAPMLPGTLVAREAAALFQALSVVEEVTAEYTYLAEAGREDDASDREDALAFAAAIEGRIDRGRFVSPDYQRVEGTSFAAPIVASVAAQMLEANPALKAKDLREGLLATAVALPNVEPIRQGKGELHARNAVLWALERGGKGGSR